MQQRDWKVADGLFLFSLGCSGSVSLLFSTMRQFYSDVMAVWSAYGGNREPFFFPPSCFQCGVIVAANWTTRLQTPAAFQPFLAAPGSFSACQHSCCPKGETLVIISIIPKKNHPWFPLHDEGRGKTHGCSYTCFVTDSVKGITLPSPPPSLTGFLSFFICITVSRLSLIASLLPRGSYR